MLTPSPMIGSDVSFFRKSIFMGKSRKEIDKIVRNHGYQLSGGGYSRYLQNSRKLLSQFILQKELEFITQHSGENDAG